MTVKKMVFILVGMLVLSVMMTAGVSAAEFTDVPESHWAYPYVEEMSRKGIVTGRGDGIFDPDGLVTAAEFSTMAARAFYPEELAAEQYNYSTWYGAAMELAFNKGLLVYSDFVGSVSFNIRTGESFVTYTPDQPVSRMGMAVFLDAWLSEQMRFVWNEKSDITKLPDYVPYGDFNTYSYAISRMYSAGVLNGIDAAGTFNGSGTMTRAQACKVLSTALALCEKANAVPVPDNRYYTSQRLANGLPATPDNIVKAMWALKDPFMQEHGVVWDEDPAYYYPERVTYDGVTLLIGGCNSFVRFVQDDIFGWDYMQGVTFTSFPLTAETEVLPGDQIWWDEHTVIVVSDYGDVFTVAEGNLNDSIWWGNAYDRETLIDLNAKIYRVVDYPNLNG